MYWKPVEEVARSNSPANVSIRSTSRERDYLGKRAHRLHKKNCSNCPLARSSPSVGDPQKTTVMVKLLPLTSTKDKWSVAGAVCRIAKEYAAVWLI